MTEAVEWREVTLGTLEAESHGVIQTGPFGSQLHASDYSADGTPVVMPTNIRDLRISTDGIARVADEHVERLARHRLRAGDIVYSRRGDVEKCALVTDDQADWLCGTGCLLVRVQGPTVDARCLAYLLSLSSTRAWISQHAVGATMPNLNTGILREVPVVLPLIDEQRGIAATLGALDDKIESNRRAISLIQQLSRASYVAWHDVITGLRRTTFGEFANVFGGATPKTAEPSYWNGGIAWVTPTDITALGAPYLFRTARTISQGGLGSTSATLHPPGTIFMTSRATIGAFAVAQLPAATNQGFIAVRPRMPEHRWFLFEEMRSRVPEMLDRANGSTFMELSRGNFKLMPLDVPSDGALRDLNAQLAPLHARAAQLGQENARLADVRDALLPELLSGRIRVPEAREAVEEAVG